jgi:hypothetical protein
VDGMAEQMNKTFDIEEYWENLDVVWKGEKQKPMSAEATLKLVYFLGYISIDC